VVNKAAPDPAMLKDMVKVAMRVWDASAKPASIRRRRLSPGSTTQNRDSEDRY